MKHKAVCIRCGTFKKAAFAPCPECGLAPKSDYEAARALILAEKTFYGDVEIGRSSEELKNISQSIKSGRPYPIDGEEQKAVVRAYYNYLQSQPKPKPSLIQYLKWIIPSLILITIGALITWWLLVK